MEKGPGAQALRWLVGKRKRGPKQKTTERRRKNAREEVRAPPVARDTQRNAGRNRGRIRAQNLKERPNYRAPNVGVRSEYGT